MRDHKMTPLGGAGKLKALKRRMTIEKMVSDRAVPRDSSPVRIGELFVLSGLLTERHVLSAVELGLMSGKPVGRMLIDLGMTSDALLNHALRLQELAREKTLTPQAAAQLLNQFSTKN